MNRQRAPLPTRIQDTAPLPPSFHAVLDAGLERLGITLREDQRLAIEGHVRLLLAWTAAVNLTAIRDPAEVARLHVLDSLSAAPVIRDPEPPRLLDLGSGGGFPGLPLAVALDVPVLLVDSVGKKVRFLDAAISALDLRDVRAVAARGEALGTDPEHRERWRLVTARAVASLGELIEVAFPLLEVGGRLVAWKRGPLDEELAAARRAAAELGGGELAVHRPDLPELPGHALVRVRKLGPTDDRWPRDPAVRQRRPW